MINDCCENQDNHSHDARMYAYSVLYQAQKEANEIGEKLHWSEEREIFIQAAHEYDLQNGGKIDTEDTTNN